MTWVKRQADRRQPHLCDAPPIEYDVGDLWRCDTCGQLWRGDYACASCRAFGASRPHGGQHQLGRIWVHAGWWERLWHWRTGRPPRKRQYGTRRPDWSVMPEPEPATEDDR